MDQKIDYSKRAFAYYPTNAIVVSRYVDGTWTAPEVTDNFNLTLNCFAGVFHYAPSCFEGLKAYRGCDGKIRLFRPLENAKRMIRSAAYIDMEAPSEELFMEACMLCVKANIDYLPPYESGASLYLRPTLFGMNPQLGINSPKDVMFVVMSSGVGTYGGGKLLTPTNAVISRNYDRAATHGSGGYKLGANYAQSLHAYNLAHKMGYRELLFLDTATHSRIEEFGSSNFFAIKDGAYITPDSTSVLPSLTNLSLRELAPEFGLRVERRVIPVDELASVDEAGSCGTAVVINPLYRIDDKKRLEDTDVVRSFNIGTPEKCGRFSEMLYHRMVGIQKGLEEDTYNWCVFVD